MEDDDKTQFPERCLCGQMFAYSEGRTHATYLCGSRHSAKGLKRSYACKLIQDMSAKIAMLKFQVEHQRNR